MFTKISLFVGVGLFASMTVRAQDDAVALRIGERLVTRAELSEAYKNYVADEKDKRKTVDLFVQRYIGIQRKAMAARAAKLDTSIMVRNILDGQKSLLLRPLYLSDVEKESEASKVYTATKAEFAGKPLLKVATIFRYLPQNATPARVQREQKLTDSLYNVLLRGADFITLAKRYSTKGADSCGGYVPSWLFTGKTWADYEAQAYTLKLGEYSKPFLTVRGFYIVKLLEEQPFPAFESVKVRMVKYMDENGITSKLIQDKFEQIRNNTPRTISTVQLKKQIERDLWRKNPAVYRQYVMYEDGILSAEWDKGNSEQTAQTLEKVYPVTINERVVRTLEKDY